MNPSKACPVVLRRRGGTELLAFVHPLAGIQLVKGTIEPGESPAQAAARELLEEAGVRSPVPTDALGLWDSGHLGQVWSFHVCRAEQELADEWVHRTADAGGLDLRFFWHGLDGGTSEDWHPVHRRAVAFVRAALASMAREPSSDPTRSGGPPPSPRTGGPEPPLPAEGVAVVAVRRDDLSSPEVHSLVAEHLSGMHGNSPPGHVHALAIGDLRAPSVTFWTAWADGVLCGCGALKELDPLTGEVKSMRTRAAFLRRGVGQAILDEIVRTARRRGYSRLLLETGTGRAFEPAHALYRRNGFAWSGPFGGYTATDFNVFMVKVLV